MGWREGGWEGEREGRERGSEGGSEGAREGVTERGRESLQLMHDRERESESLGGRSLASLILSCIFMHAESWRAGV